jgi:signal transduction histidine kinase
VSGFLQTPKGIGMNEPPQQPQKSSSFQASISSLTLGTLYEAVLAFSSQDSFETFWPSVCQNARWLIPSRRMGILLCGVEESFEIAGMFEHGSFRKPLDSQFTPERGELKRSLAQKNALWIGSPGHPTVGETDHFTRWLLQDHPDALLVLPMRVKGKTVGALLFVMAPVEETDKAMLSTLGTIYALHTGMAYTLLRISEERKQMQDQLILQDKMASLGSLVAGIAHEINSPIGTLQSATDVVARCVKRIESVFVEGKTPEDVFIDGWCQKAFKILKENTELIAIAGGRIANIVRSLRNFARLDEAEYQRASLREGLESTLTLLEGELKNRITVVKEFHEIPEIFCFPGQLNQVFMSLLQNATEAIEGPGTIRIKTFTKDGFVHIQISDNGRGIAPEKLKRIFDFTFSERGPRVRMGSGLVTAYSIVQRHKGDIAVKSRLGEGSTFTVSLPIQDGFGVK